MKEIILSKGFVALVDDDDFEWLNKYPWCEDGKGYSVRSMKKEDGKRTNIFMHRQIIGLKNGDSDCIDHIDGNGLNNQRYNLRVCSREENNRNISIRSNNTSGYKGVSFFRRDGTWRAQIKSGSNNRHIGYFKTKEDAYSAYCQAALNMHGEFANTGNGCVILKGKNDPAA